MNVQVERLAYTMEEAALAAGLCRRTLDYHVVKGTLKTVKIGKKRLVRAEDLRRFLASDKPPGAPTPKRSK